MHKHISPSYLTCSISWCRGEWIKAAAAAAAWVDRWVFLHAGTSWKSIRMHRAHKSANLAIQSSPLSQTNRAGGPPLWSDGEPILCFQGGRVERRWWAGKSLNLRVQSGDDLTCNQLLLTFLHGRESTLASSKNVIDHLFTSTSLLCSNGQCILEMKRWDPKDWTWAESKWARVG